MICANTIEDDYAYYFGGVTCAADATRRVLGAAVEPIVWAPGCERWVFSQCTLFGHPVTIHFVTNDIIMCGHFALAIKEVTEAALPGGSLNPPSKAVNPIVTSIGGMLG